MGCCRFVKIRGFRVKSRLSCQTPFLRQITPNVDNPNSAHADKAHNHKADNPNSAHADKAHNPVGTAEGVGPTLGLPLCELPNCQICLLEIQTCSERPKPCPRAAPVVPPLRGPRTCQKGRSHFCSFLFWRSAALVVFSSKTYVGPCNSLFAS